MKNLCIIFAVIAISSQLSAQKLITTINTKNHVEAASFRYNMADGSYIYADYDTTSRKTVLFTSKGTSKEYDYAAQYSSIFDNAGNVYTYAYSRSEDSSYKYYLLKNNEEVSSFDLISDGWDINNGIIYFYAKENEKCFIGSYDTKTGDVSKGKMYDEIYLINYTEENFEGEPQGTIGFTKSGTPFYLAQEGGLKFIVIGNTEQKHYADIDTYSFRLDNNGEPAYIAKSKGVLYYDKGNTFVVQGAREYKAYDYIYGPLIFDKQNNAVYTSNDSAGEYVYRTRIMTGNKEGETYEGNIYEYKLSPAGKILYVVSTQKAGIKKGEYVYESFLVSDGEEGEYYTSVSNLKFTEAGAPTYIAGDKNNKYFVVKGSKKLSEKYDNIFDYSFLGDGSLAYAGTNYGNYEKKIPDKNFIHVFGKKYGPYEFVSMADYTTGKYVLTENGKFAFVTGRLIDRDNYIYRYKVTTSGWESGDHDAIDDIRLANGKVIYVSSDIVDKTNYIYNYNLYIDEKPVAENYDNISYLNVDKTTGKISCTACKGNNFYLMEY